MAEKVAVAEVFEPDESLPGDLRTLRRFAVLLDEAVQIPGTRKRIGLDAAIGLIPGVGDAVGALFSTWILIGALRHRVPPWKVFRMAVNIVIDLVIGLIPIAGDVFDFLFKENVSNVDILIRHRDRTRPPRSYGSIFLVFAAIFTFFVLLSIALIVYLAIFLIQFVGTL